MSTRALLKRTKKATAGSEHALNNNEDAAAIANQEAQKANQANSTQKHHPKGKGEQKIPPMKPTRKNGNRNGKGTETETEKEQQPPLEYYQLQPTARD
jgi:hypothetical protein